MRTYVPVPTKVHKKNYFKKSERFYSRRATVRYYFYVTKSLVKMRKRIKHVSNNYVKLSYAAQCNATCQTVCKFLALSRCVSVGREPTLRVIPHGAVHATP